MLRPGNAGSNDTDDHLELLDQALAALPAEFQVGHQIGDTPEEVAHPILVRADSAGATHGFVRGLLGANCDYSIGFPIDGKVRDALLLAQEEDWTPAIDTDGTRRDGAEVIELTDLLGLSRWGSATRLICKVLVCGRSSCVPDRHANVLSRYSSTQPSIKNLFREWFTRSWRALSAARVVWMWLVLVYRRY